MENSSRQFAPVVLVRLAVAVLVVVEPEDHSGVFGQFDEQRSEVSKPVLSEHLNLADHGGGMLHLAGAGGEYVVPE